MNIRIATDRFNAWSKQGKNLYTKNDLKKLFPTESKDSLNESIKRLIKSKIIERVAHGVYLYNLSKPPSKLLEEIAIAIRRGEYNYLSLESALSEYGVISQIPIDRVTIITTGRSGQFETPYGIIEFTHTQKNIKKIIAGTKDIGLPLRRAKPLVAISDLKKVGRNTHLINYQELEELINEE